MSQAFCQICCTPHLGATLCPGELRPTGPERHGWSALLETAKGLQSCGVLLAPSSGLWRARIVNYPRVPWMLPGGRGTVRFSGTTSHEAETHAVAYIHETCSEKGWKWTDDVPFRRAGDGRGIPERRKRRSLPVRYGTDHPQRLSTIVNMSEAGMFVSEPNPLPTGTTLRLELEIFGCLASLEGTVAWTRIELEPGRPRGMGVRLEGPPAVWVTYVRGLP